MGGTISKTALSFCLKVSLIHGVVRGWGEPRPTLLAASDPARSGYDAACYSGEIILGSVVADEKGCSNSVKSLEFGVFGQTIGRYCQRPSCRLQETSFRNCL